MKTILKKPVTNASFLQLVKHLPPLDMHNGPWVAGGSARRLWMDQDWNVADVDVFFAQDTMRQSWQNQLYTTWCNHDTYKNITPSVQAPTDSLWNLFNTSCAAVTPSTHPSRTLDLALETDNACSYNLYGYDQPPLEEITKLQLIKVRYAENICALWEDFDFTISCFATDGKEIWAWDLSVRDTLNNQLLINNTQRKDNLALRIIKHHVYGFEISDHLLMLAADLISRGEWQWPMNY